jgi:uncharacterized protein (TIGR00725 family)
MAQVVVGVMGAGDLATHEDTELAYQLGKSIAENGWILLTGGRKVGVMEAASQGAKASGGLVIGILPGNNKLEMSDAVDIAIVTDLIACGMGLGTASEVALALKNNRPVILLHQQEVTYQFFSHLASEQVFSAANVEQAIALSQEILLP